jgi:hypothetical protein
MGLIGGVGVEAAPGPIFRPLDDSGLDRVAVHVAEFFDPLGFGEDVEIVIAGLPNELVRAGAGEALLKDLNRGPQFLPVGFGYEEMDVVRHEDVAEDVEEVFLASFFDDPLEGVTGFGTLEEMAVAIATDGDEV